MWSISVAPRAQNGHRKMGNEKNKLKLAIKATVSVIRTALPKLFPEPAHRTSRNTLVLLERPPYERCLWIVTQNLEVDRIKEIAWDQLKALVTLGT